MDKSLVALYAGMVLFVVDNTVVYAILLQVCSFGLIPQRKA